MFRTAGVVKDRWKKTGVFWVIPMPDMVLYAFMYSLFKTSQRLFEVVLIV